METYNEALHQRIRMIDVFLSTLHLESDRYMEKKIEPMDYDAVNKFVDWICDRGENRIKKLQETDIN